MKVRTRFCMASLVVLAIASVVVVACKKNSGKGEHPPDARGVNAPVEMKVSWDKASAANGRARACDEEGGVTFITLEWDLSTCRSNCTRGLGFRCGRRVIAGCKNGTMDVYTHPGSCPNGASAYNRRMKANMIFYTDGSLKLLFQNAVPLTEKGNANFEIEADEFIDMPEGILLDGVPLDGFKTSIGTYKINYSDGAYGSVTIPGALVLQK